MTTITSASPCGGELACGPAWGQWAVMKRWMNEYTCDVGLLFRRTCHGPSGGVLVQGLCLGGLGQGSQGLVGGRWVLEGWRAG